MIINKKIKTFIIILIFGILASGNLTPIFAKNLTKSVKEKYVKILRENLTRAA